MVIPDNGWFALGSGRSSTGLKQSVYGMYKQCKTEPPSDHSSLLLRCFLLLHVEMWQQASRGETGQVPSDSAHAH